MLFFPNLSIRIKLWSLDLKQEAQNYPLKSKEKQRPSTFLAVTTHQNDGDVIPSE